MQSRQRDLIGGVVLVLFALFGLWQTTLIDLSFSSELETFTGPRAYPQILLTVILVLSLCVVVGALLDRGKSTEKIEPESRNKWKVLGAILIMVVFIALFEPLGFILTVPLLVIAAGWLNGAENMLRVATTAVLVSAFCLVLFRYGLNTVLPEGLLGIDQLF
ncbi:MAG: tripartite tricarboxylate transporter TctB family protein [Pseudomonadota bacterium]